MIDVLFFSGLAEGRREVFWLSNTFVEERGSSYLLTILRSVIFAVHQNSFCSESKNHSIQLNDGKTALLKILKTCFKSYSRMCEVQGKPHSVRVFRSDS